MEESPSATDWAADFWPLATGGASTDSFSNIMGVHASSTTPEVHTLLPQHTTAPRTAGTGLTLGRLDLLGQNVVGASASSTSTSSSADVTQSSPQPSPGTVMSSPGGGDNGSCTKRRGSDTARKDRSNILKAYLIDVGCTKIRGVRKRRKNADGEYEGGKIDWDSEWVQEQLVVPLEEFKAIRLDYERRSREKKLTDATIERDWVTTNGERVPKAKMLKNYYPTNLILHRFFDRMHGTLLSHHRVSPEIEEQMDGINPFVKTRPLAVYLPDDGHGNLVLYRGHVSRTDPLVMSYTYEKDLLEIDGRFDYADQASVAARPGLLPVHYLDDVLAKGVARRLRPTREIPALWYSAFGKGGQADELGPKEVEINLFLSCFSEAFRPTLRFLLCAPYAHKTTVTIEEFQVFFQWAAGLSDADLTVQEQLAGLVQELKYKEASRQRREDIVIYFTTTKAQPLHKPGDYYLRVSKTQPGWIAIEYVPPAPGGRTAGEAIPESGAPPPAVQPKASLFYFQVTKEKDLPARVYFMDRNESHPNIISLILKHTGGDSWAHLHQCADVKAAPMPLPVVQFPAKDLVMGPGAMMHMMVTPFGQMAGEGSAAASPTKKSSSSSPRKVSATEGVKIDGAGLLMPTPAKQQQQQQQPSSRRQASTDSFGLMAGFSNLDLPHSFGVGPSWRSVEHHLDAPQQPEQAPQQQQQQQVVVQPAHLSYPQQQQASSQQQQQQPTHQRQPSHQQPLPAYLTPAQLQAGGVIEGGQETPFYFTRSAAASSDRLNQQGGGGMILNLDDPFPLQDFLVSSTSSFGSLGLSSLAASTPGQQLGGSGGSGNRFFVDQILSGVDHLHVHNPSGTTTSSSGDISGSHNSSLLRKRQRDEVEVTHHHLYKLE